MSLNPSSFIWGGAGRRAQRTLLNIDGRFVRIHRIGAPPPGLNRLRIDAVGDDRVTFVLIHGIGLPSTYMTPLAEELAEYGEVFIMDLPGAASLPSPGDPLSISGFAALVDAAMTLNDIQDPILVGHSMGAQIVVELMARRPDHFRRACLIGPPVNAAERNLPLLVVNYLRSALFEEVELVRVATLSYLRSAHYWVMKTLPTLMKYPIEERMALVGDEARVIILHGEHDYLVPTAWADYLASQATNATCILIPGAAHSTIYSDDDDVAAAALSLLTTAEREAGARKSGARKSQRARTAHD